eukprot:scaffold34414_cov60-Phaeocystis_antarctica.AAC.6
MERARLKAGVGRARAERTANMTSMSVTLDVSKLSGWLNADAACRVERRACGARCGAGGGRAWEQRLGARARAKRTWNIQLMSVTLDVSKLSGWLKAAAFYRVEREACTRDAGRSVRAGRLDIGRGAGASGMCTGRARLKAGGQGMRGAHPEHAVHGRDLGRVEGQRLVERRRVLPSRKEGIYDAGREVRAGRREGRGAAAAQAACTG